MKRSFFRLPLPFALLFLLSLAALLTLRTALLRPPPPLPPTPPPPPPLPNATLIALASVDVAEPDLRKAIDDLLDGTFLPHRARHYPLPHYRPRGARLPTRLLRSPKVLPDFRRSLLDWLRRRRYQPDIISHLLPLVKAPIDPATPRRLYATCAVVGNSGILLRSDRGDAIDAHELVIRLNNARTEGYARNVGSKTGISFVNSNILHSCARRDGCYCHPYGDSVPILMYICQPAHLLDYAVCNASHRAPLLVTDPRFDLLCARIVKYYSLKRFTEETGRPPEEWSTAHDEKAFHYSSGMQAVMLALGICEQVSVFGFGKAAEAKHHYHSNQKKELDLHDYEAEYALYRDLVERPQVVPFLMDSGFKVPPLVLYH